MLRCVCRTNRERKDFVIHKGIEWAAKFTRLSDENEAHSRTRWRNLREKNANSKIRQYVQVVHVHVPVGAV